MIPNTCFIKQVWSPASRRGTAWGLTYPAVIPHGAREDDDAERQQATDEGGPSLQQYQDEESPTQQTEEPPIDPEQQQPPIRRRRIIYPAAVFAVLFLGACFATFSSPYVSMRYLTATSSRLFQGPYWSSESLSNWWYDALLQDDYYRHCKIDKGDDYYHFNSSLWWISNAEDPDKWSHEERLLRNVPNYVFDYAPLIHLFSDEEYWPGDIAEHLVHTTPYAGFAPLTDCDSPYNLTNLDELNKFGKGVYLKSNDNAEDRPDWLHGVKNIPRRPDGSIPELLSDDSPNTITEELRRRNRRRSLVKDPSSPGGRSDAPVALVVVPKDDGILDAFWFFFYPYNRGNSVAGIRFGDHIGDWEHTLVRFRHGVPEAAFFSEHFFGQAYEWQALEKRGRRPVGFSGVGTHAMYAAAGMHNYILPFGLLHDQTDRGPLWDPALNAVTYTYDADKDILRASTRNPRAPTGWFNFLGHWGDAQYPMSDSRQYRFATEYHYVSGPLGPRYKNLRRKHVCQQPEGTFCNVRDEMGGPDAGALAMQHLGDLDEEETMSAADEAQFLRGEAV